MQQSKFLDPSIVLDESVTFHHGLPWVLSLLCELAPKNLKSHCDMQKLVGFGAL